MHTPPECPPLFNHAIRHCRRTMSITDMKVRMLRHLFLAKANKASDKKIQHFKTRYNYLVYLEENQ